MLEFAPFTPSKIIPVIDASKNTTDNMAVILRFRSIPFVISPLYHPLCVVIWNMAATRNRKLLDTWNTAQLCHSSWLLPCPA